MESGSSYSNIFSETFELMNILFTLPIGIASVERSFSQMKMIKTRLRNRLTDVTLAQLMKTAIEGSDHTSINFEEICSGGGGGGLCSMGGNPRVLPPLCMNHCCACPEPHSLTT